MGKEADIDPRPGGRFWLNLGEGTAEGEYVELIADRRIVLTWGWVGSDTVPPGSTEGWIFFSGRLHIAAEGGDPDAASSND